MATHLKTIPPDKAGLKKEAPKRKFTFLKRVYLSDTNAQGNVYFARFFEWQGEAREEFFRVAVPIHDAFFASGYRLITVEASLEYKGEAALYDEVEIEVKVHWLRRASSELGFRYINTKTGECLAVGKQVIACAKEGKIVTAPQLVKDLLLPYVEG